MGYHYAHCKQVSLNKSKIPRKVGFPPMNCRSNQYSNQSQHLTRVPTRHGRCNHITWTLEKNYSQIGLFFLSFKGDHCPDVTDSLMGHVTNFSINRILLVIEVGHDPFTAKQTTNQDLKEVTSYNILPLPFIFDLLNIDCF
jgi:hypothetical protein